MQFLFLFLKIWLWILVLFIFYRVFEFFKMLAFAKINFFCFIKLSEQEKTKVLLAKLNFAQEHNQVRYKFILADFERFRNYSDEKTLYDLLNALSLFKKRIEKIIYDDIKVQKWKKMFFAVIDDDH